jgi:hypothetical protein
MVAREAVSEHVVTLTEPLRSAHANEDHGSLAEIR